MAFIWRRRSTTIVKLVALILAIWFCVVFLIYTDDTRRRAAQETSGYGAAVPAVGSGDPIALALKNAPDSAEDELDAEAAAAAAEALGAGPAAGAAAAAGEAGQEADVPPTAKQHKVARVKVLPRAKVAEDSWRQNAIPQSEDKIVHKQEPKEDGESNYGN